MSKDVITLHNKNFWFKILVSVIIAIEALQNLEVLGIMKNELSSLPPGVGRLTELVELNVDSNYLTHLPKELCNLNRLQELSAATNNLMSLPQGSKQFLLFTLYCHYFSSLACFFYVPVQYIISCFIASKLCHNRQFIIYVNLLDLQILEG